MLESLIIFGLMVNVFCLVFLWPRRQLLAAKFFLVVLFSQWLWQWGYLFEIRSDTVEMALFWDDVQFLPYLAIVPFWLYLSRSLADKPLLKGSGHLLVTAVIPALVLVSLGFDRNIEVLRIYESVDFTNRILTYEFGALTYISALWSYALIFISAGLLISFQRHLNKTLRLQVVFILIGMLIPTIIAMPNIAGITYFGLKDVSPFTFAVGNVAILYGITRLHSFEFQLVSQLPILAQLPVGVLILDHNKRVIEWNPLALSMLGINIDEPGLAIDQLALADQLRLNEQTLWQRDKQVLEIQYSPLRTSENLDSYIVTLKDISHRIEQQKSLEEANQSLQQLLDELTNTQTQLLTSEKQKAMTSLIHGIAHEFNTPLGNLVTLLDGFTSSQGSKEYVPLISNNVQRVIGLIERLKRIANINSDELAEPFFIRETIKDVVQAKALEMERQNVKLAVNVHVDIEQVTLARLAFESVLIQLLENTLSHAFTETTKDRKVYLDIQRNQHQFIVRFWDNGKGLPDDLKENVFAPFSNLSSQMSVTTGVGLFCIHQWVTNALKGTIETDDSIEQGTGFKMLLPFDDV